MGERRGNCCPLALVLLWHCQFRAFLIDMAALFLEYKANSNNVYPKPTVNRVLVQKSGGQHKSHKYLGEGEGEINMD